MGSPQKPTPEQYAALEKAGQLGTLGERFTGARRKWHGDASARRSRGRRCRCWWSSGSENKTPRSVEPAGACGFWTGRLENHPERDDANNYGRSSPRYLALAPWRFRLAPAALS